MLNPTIPGTLLELTQDWEANIRCYPKNHSFLDYFKHDWKGDATYTRGHYRYYGCSLRSGTRFVVHSIDQQEGGVQLTCLGQSRLQGPVNSKPLPITTLEFDPRDLLTMPCVVVGQGFPHGIHSHKFYKNQRGKDIPAVQEAVEATARSLHRKAIQGLGAFVLPEVSRKLYGTPGLVESLTHQSFVPIDQKTMVNMSSVMLLKQQIQVSPLPGLILDMSLMTVVNPLTTGSLQRKSSLQHRNRTMEGLLVEQWSLPFKCVVGIDPNAIHTSAEEIATTGMMRTSPGQSAFTLQDVQFDPQGWICERRSCGGARLTRDQFYRISEVASHPHVIVNSKNPEDLLKSL